jgi:hypothetical protein
MKRISKPIKIVIALITFLIVALLAIGLYNYYARTKVDWSKTKDFFDVLQNVVTIIAIAAGGVWGYFNFFKGRTYRPRLEPKVSGKLISQKGVHYLIVTAQLKNVGLSEVKIDQEGSGLRVFAYDVVEHTSKARSVQQSRLITLPIFKDHGWIEPGELIEDQRLVVIPDIEYVALQMSLRLVSNKIAWNSAAIIDPLPLAASSINQSQLEAGTPIQSKTKSAGLAEYKESTHEMVGGTGDLANTTTQRKEDAEESRKIEKEKKPVEIMSVEKPVEEKEELRELQTGQQLPPAGK